MVPDTRFRDVLVRHLSIDFSPCAVRAWLPCACLQLGRVGWKPDSPQPGGESLLQLVPGCRRGGSARGTVDCGELLLYLQVASVGGLVDVHIRPRAQFVLHRDRGSRCGRFGGEQPGSHPGEDPGAAGRRAVAGYDQGKIQNVGHDLGPEGARGSASDQADLIPGRAGSCSTQSGCGWWLGYSWELAATTSPRLLRGTVLQLPVPISLPSRKGLVATPSVARSLAVQGL